MRIETLTGEQLVKQLQDKEMHEVLDYFVLEYFFYASSEKNYIILYNDNNKIVGQVSYFKKQNRYLLSSISITQNNKGMGYSKLLIDTYFNILNENKVKTFEITTFSEEGTQYLQDRLCYICDDYHMEFTFTEEKDFN